METYAQRLVKPEHIDSLDAYPLLSPGIKVCSRRLSAPTVSDGLASPCLEVPEHQFKLCRICHSETSRGLFSTTFLMLVPDETCISKDLGTHKAPMLED